MENNIKVILTADATSVLQEHQKLKSRISRDPVKIKFEGITSDFSQFEKSLDAATARVTAFTATTTLIYGVGNAFQRVVSDAIQIEAVMTRIQSIFGSTSAATKEFQSSIMALANGLSVSFFDAASAAEEFSRQGLSLNETLEATKAAIMVAKLSGAELKGTIEGLTAVITTFGDETLDYVKVANKLVAVDAAFATSAAGITEGLKRVAGVAAAAGMSLDQTIGQIASLKQVTGRSEAVIGNSLKSIYTALQTEKVQGDLRDIGVETKSASGEFRNLTDVLSDLSKAYDDLSASQQQSIAQKIGKTYQANAFQGILKTFRQDQGGESQMSKATRISADATDQAESRIDALNKTTESALVRLQNSFTQVGATLGDRIGKPLVDKIAGYAATATNLLGNIFAKAPEGQETVGSKMGDALVGGIRGVLEGPGLVLLGVGIIRLFGKLAKDAAQAMASISGIQSKKALLNQTESFILNNLTAQNQEELKRIANITSVEARERAVLALLNSQIAAKKTLSAMGPLQQAGFATPRGTPIITQGAAIATAGRKATKIKADGYLPNYAKDESIKIAKDQEANEIRRGTGGARPSDKPRLDYLNLGPETNYQRKKVVTNTGEQIKRNYKNTGQDAVLTREMQGDIALAYRGYVPNYAGSIKGSDSTTLKEYEYPIKNLLGSGLTAGWNDKILFRAQIQTFKGGGVGSTGLNNQKIGDKGDKGEEIVKGILKGNVVKNPTTNRAAAHIAKLEDRRLKLGGGKDGDKILEKINKAKDPKRNSPFDYEQTIEGKKFLVDSKNVESFNLQKFKAETAKKLWNQIKFSDQKQQILDYTNQPVKIFIPEKTFKGARSLRNAAEGYMPNYKGLTESITRERNAGVPISQIRAHFDKNGNPKGVTNTRDEPGGWSDVPKKSSGYLPKMVPNYAYPQPKPNIKYSDWANRLGISPKAFNSLSAKEQSVAQKTSIDAINKNTAALGRSTAAAKPSLLSRAFANLKSPGSVVPFLAGSAISAAAGAGSEMAKDDGEETRASRSIASLGTIGTGLQGFMLGPQVGIATTAVATAVAAFQVADTMFGENIDKYNGFTKKLNNVTAKGQKDLESLESFDAARFELEEAVNTGDASKIDGAKRNYSRAFAGLDMSNPTIKDVAEADGLEERERTMQVAKDEIVGKGKLAAAKEVQADYGKATAEGFLESNFRPMDKEEKDVLLDAATAGLNLEKEKVKEISALIKNSLGGDLELKDLEKAATDAQIEDIFRIIKDKGGVSKNANELIKDQDKLIKDQEEMIPKGPRYQMSGGWQIHEIKESFHENENRIRGARETGMDLKRRAVGEIAQREEGYKRADKDEVKAEDGKRKALLAVSDIVSRMNREQRKKETDLVVSSKINSIEDYSRTESANVNLLQENLNAERLLNDKGMEVEEKDKLIKEIEIKIGKREFKDEDLEHVSSAISKLAKSSGSFEDFKKDMKSAVKGEIDTNLEFTIDQAIRGRDDRVEDAKNKKRESDAQYTVNLANARRGEMLNKFGTGERVDYEAISAGIHAGNQPMPKPMREATTDFEKLQTGETLAVGRAMLAKTELAGIEQMVNLGVVGGPMPKSYEGDKAKQDSFIENNDLFREKYAQGTIEVANAERETAIKKILGGSASGLNQISRRITGGGNVIDTKDAISIKEEILKGNLKDKGSIEDFLNKDQDVVAARSGAQSPESLESFNTAFETLVRNIGALSLFGDESIKEAADNKAKTVIKTIALPEKEKETEPDGRWRLNGVDKALLPSVEKFGSAVDRFSTIIPNLPSKAPDTAPEDKKPNTKNSGYVPKISRALQSEQRAINLGKGGAIKGVHRPVVSHNINIGNGPETLVTHTGEKIIPNFMGSGEHAILNPDMLKNGIMKKNQATSRASGYIPASAKILSAKKEEFKKNADAHKARFDDERSYGGNTLMTPENYEKELYRSQGRHANSDWLNSGPAKAGKPFGLGDPTWHESLVRAELKNKEWEEKIAKLRENPMTWKRYPGNVIMPSNMLSPNETREYASHLANLKALMARKSAVNQLVNDMFEKEKGGLTDPGKDAKYAGDKSDEDLGKMATGDLLKLFKDNQGGEDDSPEEKLQRLGLFSSFLPPSIETRQEIEGIERLRDELYSREDYETTLEKEAENYEYKGENSNLSQDQKDDIVLKGRKEARERLKKLKEGKASGYIPNFSGLSDAIQREKMVSGLPANKIMAHFSDGYPIAVTNKVDEPRGLKDVPNFARGNQPQPQQISQYEKATGQQKIPSLKSYTNAESDRQQDSLKSKQDVRASSRDNDGRGMTGVKSDITVRVDLPQPQGMDALQTAVQKAVESTVSSTVKNYVEKHAEKSWNRNTKTGSRYLGIPSEKRV